MTTIQKTTAITENDNKINNSLNNNDNNTIAIKNDINNGKTNINTHKRRYKKVI